MKVYKANKDRNILEEIIVEASRTSAIIDLGSQYINIQFSKPINFKKGEHVVIKISSYEENRSITE